MQLGISEESAFRFMHSYGTWTEMCAMMQPIEFLHLQALNKQAYQVSVARV